MGVRRLTMAVSAALAAVMVLTGCTGTDTPDPKAAKSQQIAFDVPGDVSAGPATVSGDAVDVYGKADVTKALSEIVTFATYQGVFDDLVDTSKQAGPDDVLKVVGPHLSEYARLQVAERAKAVLVDKDRSGKQSLDVLTAVRMSAPGRFDFRPSGLRTVNKKVSDVQVSMQRPAKGEPLLVTFSFAGDWRMQDAQGKPVLAGFVKEQKFFLVRNVQGTDRGWRIDVWDGVLRQTEPRPEV